jgi:hypothetical protein
MKFVKVWRAEKKTPHTPQAPCWAVSTVENGFILSTVCFVSRDEAVLYAAKLPDGKFIFEKGD